MKSKGAIGTLALLLLLAGPGAGLAQDESPATVTVVHGIPGKDLGLDPELPVDVFVSGLGCALPDFRYGDVSPRVEAPAGAYDIAVSLADPDTEPCAGPVVIAADGVPFDAGENATVIAHLTEAGEPTATKYTNDVSPSPSDQGRVAVHHTAAVGAVDVDVVGPLFSRSFGRAIDLDGVTNPQSAAADLEHGYYIAIISPAGGHPVAIDLLQVWAGSTGLVYATGSLENGTFRLLLDSQEQVDPSTGAEALVTVIHGITGADLGLDATLPVDVWISGLGCALTDFRFGDVTDRLPVPAGSYDVRISLVDESTGACEGPVAVEADGVPFEAGEKATVIAHLTAGGAPTASKFTNDLSRASSPLAGRLIVHHTAAAGAVDVGVFRRFFIFLLRRGLFEGVENGDAGGIDLFDGRYEVSIAPAGGPSIFDQKARVRRGEATLAYAVGSVESGTFQLIVDTWPLE